jgi:hypothetical protein
MNGCHLSRSQFAEAMIQEHAETSANSPATHALRHTTKVKEQDKFLVIHNKNCCLYFVFIFLQKLCMAE